MFESPSRIILGIVGACLLLTLVAVFRSHEEEPGVEPRPGSVTAASPKPKLPSRRDTDFNTSGDDDVQARRDLPASNIDAARPGTLTAPEGGSVESPGDPRSLDVASGGGRQLAAEPVPVALPEQAATGAGVPEGVDTAALSQFPGLPEGASLALPLSGNGNSLGTAIPAVEENVVYDLDEGAYFPPDARFSYADSGTVQNNAGTISFWMKPNWTAEDPRTASLVQFRTEDWSNRLQIFKNGVYLRYLFTDNTGTETNVGVDMRRESNPPWVPGEWHHIAVTWGDSLITMYADGDVTGQGTYFGALDVPTGTELYVGSDRPGGNPGADATLYRFVVADRALDHGEIVNMVNTQHP
jgi:hypothetical protein